MSTISTPVFDKIKSTFDFGVAKLPLSGPDRLDTPCYGLFRQDTGEFLGSSSVTSRYTPHTTDDVLAICEAVDNVFDGTANVDCHFKDGHYVSITPSKDFRRNIYGTVDNIFPRMIVRGGYGGNGGSFACTIGMFRDMCLNMSMLRSIKSTHVSIRHTSGLRSKMDDLIATVSNLKQGWENLFNAVELMEQNEVNLVQFLDAIYKRPTAEQLELANAGQAVRAVTMHENRTKAIVRRIMRERAVTQRNGGLLGRDGMISGWEAYNAVQGYSQHDSIRRGTPNDFARMLLTSKDSAVLKAEELALAS